MFCSYIKQRQTLSEGNVYLSSNKRVYSEFTAQSTFISLIPEHYGPNWPRQTGNGVLDQLQFFTLPIASFPGWEAEVHPMETCRAVRWCQNVYHVYHVLREQAGSCASIFVISVKSVAQQTKRHCQHTFTSSVAQCWTNNCHFIYDEVTQREKQQLRPWLNIYIIQYSSASTCFHGHNPAFGTGETSTKGRLHSYRYWLVLLQDLSLVRDLNRGWFLCKRKGVQKVTSRYSRLLWMWRCLYFSYPPQYFQDLFQTLMFLQSIFAFSYLVQAKTAAVPLPPVAIGTNYCEG